MIKIELSKTQTKIDAFKMMRFTLDRYKIIDCILFSARAEEFSTKANYGQVIAMISPK